MIKHLAKLVVDRDGAGVAISSTVEKEAGTNQSPGVLEVGEG